MHARTLLPVLLGLALVLPAWSAPLPEAGGPTRIARLIEQLGSAAFTEREKATQELEAVGTPALPALRLALHSDDAEVSRRAEELVASLQRRARNEKLLAATKVRLSGKNMPLADAVAMLSNQAGCEVLLHDPLGKLQTRTVTLNTGPVSFWQALDLLCVNAGLVEGPLSGVPGAAPPAAPSRGPSAAIHLIDGKFRPVATAYLGALRIQIPAPGRELVPAVLRPDKDTLNLVASLEPRISWADRPSLGIVAKAIDERGRILKARDFCQIPQKGTHRSLDIRFEHGDRPAGSLKEFTGTLTATLRSPPEVIMSVDNITRAAGKTVKGEDGGYITVLAARELSNLGFMLQVEMVAPLNVVAADPGAIGVNFAGGPVQLVPNPLMQALLPMPLGAARAQIAQLQAERIRAQEVARRIQVLAPAGIPFPGGAALPARAIRGTARPLVDGLALLDEKGNPLPLMSSAVSRTRGLGGFRQFLHLTFKTKPGQHTPARLVYTGSRLATIDVPFTLKDVPLE